MIRSLSDKVETLTRDPSPNGRGVNIPMWRRKRVFSPFSHWEKGRGWGLSEKERTPNPPLSTQGLPIRWDQVLCYLAQNSLRVIEDLIVTESQHAETLAKHVRSANLVVLPLPVRVVGRAVTFSYQAGFPAVEVGDITAELMLAPEFEAPAAVDCEVVARAGSRPASVVL